MKFRANLKGVFVGGALASVLAFLPGITMAGGIEGAWDQFHKSHVKVDGAAPATSGIVGAWDSFHGSHVARDTVAAPSVAGGSLQNPWDAFHQDHVRSIGSRG